MANLWRKSKMKVKMVNTKKPSEVEEYDENGWSPIHHAANDGSYKIVTHLIEKKASRIELKTLDKKEVTPIWIAASQGHVETVNALLLLGADRTKTDNMNKSLIEIVIENVHIKLLKNLMCVDKDFFLVIWEYLVNCYTVDTLENVFDGKQLLYGAATIIKTFSEQTQYVAVVLEKGFMSHILPLYQKAVQQNLLELEICLAKTFSILIHRQQMEYEKDGGLLEMFTYRLSSSDHLEIHIIVLDVFKHLAEDEEFSHFMLTRKLFSKLLQYTDSISQVEDKDGLLLNTLIVLHRCLLRYKPLQEHLHEEATFLPLIKYLLSYRIESVQLQTLKVLTEFTKENTINQTTFTKFKLVAIVSNILKSKNKLVIIQACNLVFTTTKTNEQLQKEYIDTRLVDVLMELLCRYKDHMMHEHVVSALWSLAGEDHKQQVFIVKSIELKRAIEFIKSNSSTALQLYGFQILNILVQLYDVNHKEVSNTGVVAQIVTCIKSPTIENNLLLIAFQSITALCINRGFRANKTNQINFLEKGTLQILSKIYTKSDTLELRLQCLYAASSVCLCQPKQWRIFENEIRLTSQQIKGILRNDMYAHTMLQILSLIYITDSDIVEEKDIELNYELFETKLHNSNEYHEIACAFQIIILQNCIKNKSSATMAITGINILTNALHSRNDYIVAKSSDFIGGTALYCSGVRAAYISINLIEKLSILLDTKSDEMIKASVSVAIVTMSNSLQGQILLLQQCRKKKRIYDQLVECTQGVKLSKHFMERWNHYKILHTKQIP